jgi:AraC-like DNA-binding protein/quercetin dioxygenase-like cupin family protein
MEYSAVDIPKVAVHTSCICYQNGKKQTIKIQKINKGEICLLHLKTHKIVFVLEGCVHISTQIDGDTIMLGADELVFLPVGTKMEYEAVEPGVMLIIQLDNLAGNIPECNTFRFQRDTDAIDYESVRGLHILKANERVRHLLRGVVATEQDGLKCGIYANLIVGQLLFLIQVYSTQEEYSRFYSIMLTPDVAFSDFIYKKWKELPTVNELADAMNMNVKGFTRHFRKVFSEAPGTWLKRRRSEAVYYDLCSSHKTLKSVAMDYGFSMPNFIRYCRMNYGSTPGAIRNRLCAESDYSSCDTNIKCVEDTQYKKKTEVA